jgi:hypothetical protein
MSRRKSFVELAEEHTQAWREFAVAIGLVRLADWLNDKLKKEERK